MKTVSASTIKKLFAISNNRCAFPKCTQVLCDLKTGLVIGEICHIKARNEDGPRYDKSQSEDERNGFENLILLCPNHHTIIDADTEAYTNERLLNMKSQHELASQKEIECPDNIVNQFISSLTISATSKENMFSPVNPIGGQYAQLIQNLHGVISLDKNYSYADILAELYSKEVQLSELLAKTLNLAKKNSDHDLIALCINELSGWTIPDPIKAYYRKKEVFISLHIVQTAFNFKSNEEIWREFAQRSDEFIKNDFFFNEGVPVLEQALELNKSIDPNRSFIHMQEKQGNLVESTPYPDLIIHIYCKGDTYHHLVNGIKNNLANELMKRIRQ